MMFHRWPDPERMRDRIEATGVTPDETFSLDFIADADPALLAYNGQTITVNVDNGKWIWQVVEVDPAARTVRGVWPD